MKTIRAIFNFLGSLLATDTRLSDELRRYCQHEGIDEWTLSHPAATLSSANAPPANLACRPAPQTSWGVEATRQSS